MATNYPFHPWVRRTCRKALVWGLGVVAILAGITYVLKQPGSVPAARAFGVLMLYSALFWITLAKVWWTAGSAAIMLEDDFVAYRPLHTFSPRRIALDGVLACGPRPGTQALRLVHLGKKGEEREFYLNLAVIKGRHGFLEALGRALERRGLKPVPGETDSWRHPQWDAW